MIMAGNSNLQDSKANKQDEFYTQLSMIEDELKHYREYFKDKVVYCNCDDPRESNFWKYFAINFEFLGLKKLIATHYDEKKPTYKLELVRDINGDNKINENDIVETPFTQNGDFRSPECIELLKEADIVVTNPPFSLFRQYIGQLMEYDKQFIIIGRMGAATYKEVFPLFKENKVWLGNNSGHFWFRVPNSYEEKKTDFKIDENGNKWRRMGNIAWFTNLPIKKRFEPLILFKKYDPETYPKYDNYDAIEVGAVADIPCDYYDVMGVPLTFLDKYDPEQFEILGLTSGRQEYDKLAWPTKIYENAIQHNTDGTTTSGSKVNTGAAMLTDDTSKIYYTADNQRNPLKIAYVRLLIKRKDV